MAPLIRPMPRPRWPHLLREVSRHGTPTWVVRIGHGPRTPIREPYGTPEFEAAYHAAIRGEALTPRGRGRKGSLKWLWERYRESSAWAALEVATRRQRENIMKHVIEAAGNAPLGEIGRREILAGREQRVKTPSQANNFLNTMRALFAWAKEADFVDDDPTAKVKNVKRPKSGGFPVWTEADIEKFERRWPIGSRERLALAILLYTGLRRGDAACLGRQHVTDGVIVVKTEKTGEAVTIPILPELAAVIAATPAKGFAFVATASGEAMTKESFGNWFRESCDKAGVKGKSAHGLRKAGATRAANNGATVEQLNAIFGWRGAQTSSIYTRTADRIRLARDAISKLQKNESSTSYSQPSQKVGNDGPKSQ